MILSPLPASSGHEATRLPAHDPARPQPGQGFRRAGRQRRSQPRLTPANCAGTPASADYHRHRRDPRRPRSRPASRPRRPDSGGLSYGYDNTCTPQTTSTAIRTSFSQHRLSPVAASNCEDPDSSCKQLMRSIQMSAYLIVEFTVKEPDVYREQYAPKPGGRPRSTEASLSPPVTGKSCTAMARSLRGTHAVSDLRRLSSGTTRPNTSS